MSGYSQRVLYTPGALAMLCSLYPLLNDIAGTKDVVRIIESYGALGRGSRHRVLEKGFDLNREVDWEPVNATGCVMDASGVVD